MKTIILNCLSLLQLTLATPTILQRRQDSSAQQKPNLGGGSCMLHNGILWYLGGYQTPRTTTYSNKLLSFNLNTDFNLTNPDWVTSSSSIDSSVRFQYSPSAATDTNNGIFYIFGANSQSDPVSLQPAKGDNKLYSYSVDTAALKALTDNPSSSDPQWRFQHTLNYNQNGNQLIMHGGRYYSSQSGLLTTSNSTYLFDVGKNSWSLISTDGPALYYHYTLIYKNKLYVFGGMGDNQILNNLDNVNIMDLNTKTWTKATLNGPAPLPAIGMSLVLSGSNAASFGGYANDQGQFSGVFLAGYTLDLDNLNWDMKKTDDLQNAVQRAFMCVVTTAQSNYLLTQGEIKPSSTGTTVTNALSSTAQLWNPNTWSLILKNIPTTSSTQNPVNSKIGIILMAVLIPLAFIFITWLTCYCYKKSQAGKSVAYTVNEPVWTDPYEKSNNNSYLNATATNKGTDLTLENDRQIDYDDQMNLDTDLFANPDTVLSASQSQMNILPVNGRRSYYE
ncbi:hypothetical protein CONCODRAFT_82855 [Conidiobolus coronatus NRRL 28638]|uniref:Galactose oxidase n=1 Tax=Conidiobolus coronatus (strain ATCC 28846 / CBS 209.66 / NRRL 28638) TaxID=796925 RepID=A0A137PHT5_CONC2|nr:hypothetical protein CONCODRAFT_82855 [Conidiobolus coronatus NRRL 28638]|eukprot:KXN74558.1 hypothetical protein CONCODRAFT_82855 [Conidiobolus coronatus NRRL 28638]